MVTSIITIIIGILSIRALTIPSQGIITTSNN